MDSPPISVVIPAFNAGAFLPAAVQSVLNQSYGRFELLIILHRIRLPGRFLY